MTIASAVVEPIARYFYAIDARRYDLLMTCFDPGIRFRFEGEGLTLSGLCNLLRYFTEQRAGRPSITCHSVASQGVALRGSVATADTFAVACLVMPAANGGKILVRGLRYRDVLTATAGGWRIARRRHRSLWQYSNPLESAQLRDILS